jgi:2-oxoglutarate ferredoxin oxidoreductase subunit gamma
MTNELLFAGFGGQGVLLIGRMLTYAGMLAGKEVSWIPSYGPEMRGGTASCSVIVSDEAIGSPVVTKPNVLVAMNKPSLDKFESAVQPGGVVIVNRSLIEEPVKRHDLQVYYVPLNELALEGGSLRHANMVALGALIGATDIVELDFLKNTFVKNFAKKPEAVELNMQAVRRGVEFVLSNKQG